VIGFGEGEEYAFGLGSGRCESEDCEA